MLLLRLSLEEWHGLFFAPLVMTCAVQRQALQLELMLQSLSAVQYQGLFLSFQHNDVVWQGKGVTADSATSLHALHSK